MYIGATWQIWLDDLCTAVMKPYVKLLWTLYLWISPHYSYPAKVGVEIVVKESNGVGSRWQLLVLLTKTHLSKHTFHFLSISAILPSVLWHCWLGSRKGIRPVKIWVVGCWHGYLSGERCRLMAQLMPLPLTVSCLSKIQISFAFLVPAHPGSSRKGAVKCVVYVCVCACVCARACARLLLQSCSWWTGPARESSGICRAVFLQARCPSCHSTKLDQ